ncbi:MAG: vitamin K epoxide reductase family protein [Solirubrobacterales bacterium]|nr:vitamin K epoxide reductase family protein [Solirubrobacterales bacterium]
MSDKIDLLRNGIPAEVAVVILAIVILPVIALVVSGRREGDAGENVLRLTGFLLCAAGLVVAGYVFYTAVILNEIPQCVGGGGGCSVVEKSKYSHLLGIHVSVFGLIGYLLILGCFVWRGDRARIAGLALSLFGFAFSLYLTYLELWEILAICQWCVTSAVLMTMLFVISAVRLWRHYGLDETNP